VTARFQLHRAARGLSAAELLVGSCGIDNACSPSVSIEVHVEYSRIVSCRIVYSTLSQSAKTRSLAIAERPHDAMFRVIHSRSLELTPLSRACVSRY